jgi:hypothetical protein
VCKNPAIGRVNPAQRKRSIFDMGGPRIAPNAMPNAKTRNIRPRAAPDSEQAQRRKP